MDCAPIASDVTVNFKTSLLARARGLRLGDPMDTETQVAPLANEPHLRKVTGMIEQAKSDGAVCLLDGIETAAGRGVFYVGPTVFGVVTPDMQLWSEEMFGPVLAVTTFETEAEAIAAGTVYINHYRSVDPASPIGGIKLSGYGRELGPNAIKDFCQVKSVWISTAPVPNPFS